MLLLAAFEAFDATPGKKLDSLKTAVDDAPSGSRPLLEISSLTANVAGNSILKGVDLTVNRGEVHAIMGPNGCGKSTLSKVLIGHPSYVVTGGEVTYRGEDLLELETEDRAQQGIFLAFQYPVEIPGVDNADFLRLAVNKRRVAQGVDELDSLTFTGLLAEKMDQVSMSTEFIGRDVNAGFSGGEKKRNEILQMAMLDPELAILDETDSGGSPLKYNSNHVEPHEQPHPSPLAALAKSHGCLGRSRPFTAPLAATPHSYPSRLPFDHPPHAFAVSPIVTQAWT